MLSPDTSDNGEVKIFGGRKDQLTSYQIVIYMINLMIGTGPLKLGYAFRCGVILGSLFTILFAIFGFMSSHLFIKTAAHHKASTFEEQWRATFGTSTIMFPAIASFSIFWIIAIFYLQFLVSSLSNIILRYAPNVTPYLINPYVEMGIIFATFGMFTIINYSVSILFYISVLAIFCIVFLIIHTIYWLAHTINEVGFDPTNSIAYFHFDQSLADCIGSLLTAYCYQPFSFPGLRHVRDLTLKSGKRIFIFIMVTVCSIYLLFGITGYFTFFDKITSDLILDQYPQNGIVFAANIAVFVLILCSLPVVFSAARYSLISSIYNQQEIDRYIWITFGIIMFLSGIVVSTLSNIVIDLINYLCNICAISVSYIIPSILFLKTFGMKDKFNSVLAIILLVVAAAGTAFITYNFAISMKKY